MITNPKHIENLISRVRSKYNQASDHLDTLEDMKFNLYKHHRPWDNEEEYEELMGNILEFLGDA